MKPGDLVKYRERWSCLGIDRGELIGIVLEMYEDQSVAAMNTFRNQQARVQWSHSIYRTEHRWWAYVQDLQIVSEI